MLIFISFFCKLFMTESVQNIQKKTLLDNSQCNKVNKDNLKNKGKHTFDGIGMCGVGV